MAYEICSLTSEVGMSEFTERLHLLTQVRDAWAAGKKLCYRTGNFNCKHRFVVV